MISAAVIIPAKTTSTRLPGKNFKKINGKTLLERSIWFARTSPRVVRVIVASDSPMTCQHHLMGAGCSPDSWVILPEPWASSERIVDVYRFVADREELGRTHPVTHVIALQPDHPDRNTDLDGLLSYAVENRYDDLVTVEGGHPLNLRRSGSVRIMTLAALVRGGISDRVGVHHDGATNIHTLEDLLAAEERVISVEGPQ